MFGNFNNYGIDAPASSHPWPLWFIDGCSSRLLLTYHENVIQDLERGLLNSRALKTITRIEERLIEMGMPFAMFNSSTLLLGRTAASLIINQPRSPQVITMPAPAPHIINLPPPRPRDIEIPAPTKKVIYIDAWGRHVSSHEEPSTSAVPSATPSSPAPAQVAGPPSQLQIINGSASASAQLDATSQRFKDFQEWEAKKGQ
jgi:hypothetical protein